MQESRKMSSTYSDGETTEIGSKDVNRRTWVGKR